MNLKPSECWTKPKIVKLSNRYTGGVIELAAKNRVAAKDPEKVAEEKKKAATDSKLLSSNPSALSEEALDAALAAAKAKLEDSGFGDRAQSVVDKLKEELQARQDEDGKQAEAEEIAKTGVADKMVQEGKADTIRKAAENRAKAHKEKAESSPEAKRMNVAKQGAEPGTAAANTLAKLPPAEKAKIKARAKLAEKAKQAKEKSPEADPAKKPDAEEPPRDEKKKKDIKLSNGVNVVLDFSSVAPKGQLAFRYKHGWILINPLIPSRGKLGGGLARKHGVKSGTTTKGHFAKNSNGKGSKFVAESTGHPTLAQQMKDTANKLNFQMAQKKEDAALKEEVKQVKVETAEAEYEKAKEEAKKATVAALAEEEHLAKAEKHQKAYEAHSKAQTKAADLAEVGGNHTPVKAAHHSDMALLHQKQVPLEKQKHEAEVKAAQDKAENEYMGQAAKAAEETSKVLAIHPDKHGELKSAHLDAAIAHGHAENLAKAAGKPELAAEHHKAMEHQKKLAKEEYAKAMAEAKASGEKAGKEAYASLQEFKPGGQVSGVKEVTDPKKLEVLDAIESLPEEEYDKAPPSAWKKYFESTYDIQSSVLNGAPNKDAMEKGTEAHQVLKQNGVSDSVLEKANSAMYHKIKAAGAPKKAEKTYTKEDFKVTLPGPGMYADGNAISKLHDQIVKEENDAKAEAMQAAYEDALAEFKAKHGKEFNPSAVEKQSATSTFVPQLGDGGFFDAAKELGYHHPDFNEDVTEGWKPPAGTTGALKIYTGSGYSSINAQLRKYGTTGGSNDKTIASMDKAFAAAPGLSKDMVTVRRLKDDGPFPGNPPPMEPGATAIDYGYGSTSKSTDAWSGSVVLEVRIPKGTKVVDVNHNNVVSASMGEQEILLDRGAKYRVVSDSKEGFQRHLVVEVVSTGHVKGED